MRWINAPDSYASRPLLALLPAEVETIAELLRKVRRDAEKKAEYYTGLHESGEATDRQQTLMVQYTEQVEFIDKFIQTLKQ